MCMWRFGLQIYVQGQTFRGSLVPRRDILENDILARTSSDVNLSYFVSKIYPSPLCAPHVLGGVDWKDMRLRDILPLDISMTAI